MLPDPFYLNNIPLAPDIIQKFIGSLFATDN
jgi:hypothetical protein